MLRGTYAAHVNALLRILGLTDATKAELRASAWTAAMFCAGLASTFLLRPIRDQFGVDQGVDAMPRLYGITLIVTVLFAPAFWKLADKLPSRRFVPIALHVLASSMLLVFGGLLSVGAYDWKSDGARWFGEAFWGFYSAFNLAVPALVWVHAVERFDRRQALRLFGTVGIGGTSGAALGSWLAQTMAANGILPAWCAIGSLALLEVACLCHARSLRACDAMQSERTGLTVRDEVSRGGMFAGLRALRASGYLRAIAGYMVLLAATASAFAFYRTRMLAEQLDGGRAQHGWLAHQEVLSQGLVLTLQLFCTGRLLRRLPPVVFLTMSPLLSGVGLLFVHGIPSVDILAVVMVSLRGVQFALEKPSREALYTPLDLETKHKAKFVIDTVALRFGDFLGACLQYAMARQLGFDARSALFVTLLLVGVWALLGARLGRQPAP